MNDDKREQSTKFETKKLISFNKFFMKNFMFGLILIIFLFVLTIVLLILIISNEEIDMAVRISIISMVVTFSLTTSKTLLDRLIEVVTYTIRLLGEEQRALNKKLGLEMDDVSFELKQDKGVKNHEN